jgi:hypothetical protein
MDPLTWFQRRVPGFDLLSGQERKAISDFLLLWSLYEASVLDTSGNANRIIHTVKLLKDSGRLRLEPLRPAIKHFLTRYCNGTDLTDAFNELHLRHNDHPELVEKVICEQSKDDAEVLSAALIIVFRLRNNLFHGVKWRYGIMGQLDNFRNANDLLMSVIEMYESRVA